jgi:hypothetical protein
MHPLLKKGSAVGARFRALTRIEQINRASRLPEVRCFDRQVAPFLTAAPPLLRKRVFPLSQRQGRILSVAMDFLRCWQ